MGHWAYRRPLSPGHIEVAESVRKLRELEWERPTAEATVNRYLEELEYDA